jgi:hypothetical protein
MYEPLSQDITQNFFNICCRNSIPSFGSVDTHEMVMNQQSLHTYMFERAFGVANMYGRGRIPRRQEQQHDFVRTNGNGQCVLPLIQITTEIYLFF